MTTATVGAKVKAAAGKNGKANGKAKTSAKATAKPAKPRKPPVQDDCRAISKAIDKKYSAQQIRVMKALRDCKTKVTDSAGRKAIDREDLKELVGIGRDGAYSQSWLADLWALDTVRPKLVNIEELQPTPADRTKQYHSLTKEGAKVLEAAEKKFKEFQAKEKAKGK